jgi:hypothetical protein
MGRKGLMRTGIANLPLHYGKAPSWLFSRMKKLGREITIVIIKESGPEEVLKKLSDPFWFQAFGSVLGFDWHSSGLTTTVCGALKEGLKGTEKDLGIFVAGGKGKVSRKTPEEIQEFGAKHTISKDADDLVYASRMSAKVDNTALQDGYQVYHHNFIFTKSGLWTVVQQGMNPDTGWARRYHWLSSSFNDFVCEPHAAICSDQKGKTLNMVAKESGEARKVSAQLSGEKPEGLLRQLKKLKTLSLPSTHQVLLENMRLESLQRIFLKTYERKPPDFEKLLGMRGVGPKTIRALALISELVYGATPSFRDPVKFSFAHGGKDGHPYPVNRKRYDDSIRFLSEAVSQAKIGRSEKLKALKRLGKGDRLLF